MLAARADDGRFGPFTPVIGTTPGVWRPTPPLFAADPAPWVANVRPFLVGDVEMLRTDAPNALTSRAYAQRPQRGQEDRRTQQHDPDRG